MAKAKKSVKKKSKKKKSLFNDNFIHMMGMFPAMTVVLRSPLKRDVQSLTLAYATTTFDKDLDLFWGLTAGASFLHPKDQYDKQKGRAMALANIKEYKLKVLGVRLTKTHVFVDLEPLTFEVVSKDDASQVLLSATFDVSLRLNKKTGYTVSTFTYPREKYEEISAQAEWIRQQQLYARLLESKLSPKLFRKVIK